MNTRIPQAPLFLFLLLSLLVPIAQAQLLGGKGVGGILQEAQVEEAPEERDPVVVTAFLLADEAPQGGEVTIAVVMDHAPGWHTWPAADLNALPAEIDAFALKTEFGVSLADDLLGSLGPTQYAPLHDLPNPLGNDPPTVKSFDGRAVSFIPMILDETAPVGEHTIKLSVFWQSCNDTTCLPPETRDITLTLSVISADQAASPIPLTLQQTEDASSFDYKVFAAIRSGEAAPREAPSASGSINASFFGIQLPSPTSPVGIVLLLMLSIVGGFILNLTPCVLPVIPIKVMTLTQHAGEHPRRALILGAIMAAGVVFFWVGIGIPAALFSAWADPSRIFGIWWLTASIGTIIILLSLGLMGLFTIQLPQSAYAINPKADTPFGSFLFGVMTGILGLPCFGFVAGALLAGAALMPTWMILAVFVGIGVGMAFPYLLLSAKPSLLKSVPRTGPASELVKQVMGLMLLGAGAFFLGSGIKALLIERPYIGQQLHIYAAILFIALAGVWLMFKTIAITKKPTNRFVFAGTGALIAILSTGLAASIFAASGPSPWKKYTPETLSASLDSGKVVIVDFTADWCINCKVLEETVLNTEPVRSRIRDQEEVVMIKADLTSTSAPGWEYLADLGRTGIPTLVIYGPGYEEPWIANAYTSDQVITALDAAANAIPPASTELSSSR